MSHGYINKKLYEARLAIGLDHKQASKLLHITKLHLKLIEKGYLNVSKRKQQTFIQVYNLRSNFFSVNSNYVANIDKQTDQEKQNAKTKKFIASPGLRWTSLALTVVNAGMAGWGIYCLNKHYVNPTSAWTEDFRTFWTNLKATGKQSPSVIYPGDIKYTITESKVEEFDDGYCDEKLSTFGKEYNADDTSIDAVYNFTKTSTVHPILTKYSAIQFNTMVYNKKKLVFCSFYNTSADPTFSIVDAIGILDDSNILSLRPFTYYQNGSAHEAKQNSALHDEFTGIFNQYLSRAYANFNIIFAKHKLGYTNVHYLINDLSKMSRDRILHFRMGIWFTILGAAFGVGFAFVLALSFYFYYQHKKKGTYLTRYKKDKQPKEVLFANYKKYKKDLNVKLIIPEFVLIIIGLLILALSQVAVYLSITYFFKPYLTIDPQPIKSFASNLLIAGVMLLFYVKLDNYTTKSIRQLLVSIFAFVFGGLVFYIAECTLFYAFAGQSNIFSIIFQFMSSLLPGNFIWPLALYALLFLFLFTTPGKYKHNPTKLRTYRLMSLIPTVILIFSLVWQFSIKQNVNVPYYVSFLFFSKGPTLTLFFLVYTYVLFFYQWFTRRYMGYVNAQTIFFNSKRYFFSKNAIAAITLAILLVIELCFKFLNPVNSYNLGNNWAIGIIIPFVLFYHPHLGNRNKAWDISAMSLKGILTFIGYAVAIGEMLTYMNFGEIFFILN